MFPMPVAEFEAEVAQVIAGLPKTISSRIANVSFVVAEGKDNLNLLGLYHGIPLTNRSGQYSFALPDVITIFWLPILLRCATRSDVTHQVEITVKHEIGHYFGISDDRLHELGWA